jgi:hypothetical protein
VTRLAVLLLLAALASGCSGADDDPDPAPPTSAAPSGSPTAARAVPAPNRLACYRLQYDEAVAPTTERKPSSCRREHTAMTFHVGTLDALVEGHLLAVDSRRVQQQVAAECPRRFASFVGGTEEDRRLSMLRAVWFTPTVELSDRGADWFRCDVIAVAGDESLAPLSGRLAGVLSSPQGQDRYGMCGTAQPGAEDFERVVCSAGHSWRALSTVTFPGASSYPGEERVRGAGERECEAAGRAAADDALNFQWGYEWPTRKQWQSGHTHVTCWAPD